jgi:hypothetical protein
MYLSEATATSSTLAPAPAPDASDAPDMPPQSPPPPAKTRSCEDLSSAGVTTSAGSEERDSGRRLSDPSITAPVMSSSATTTLQGPDAVVFKAEGDGEVQIRDRNGHNSEDSAPEVPDLDLPDVHRKESEPDLEAAASESRGTVNNDLEPSLSDTSTVICQQPGSSNTSVCDKTLEDKIEDLSALRLSTDDASQTVDIEHRDSCNGVDEMMMDNYFNGETGDSSSPMVTRRKSSLRNYGRTSIEGSTETLTGVSGAILDPGTTQSALSGSMVLSVSTGSAPGTVHPASGLSPVPRHRTLSTAHVATSTSDLSHETNRELNSKLRLLKTDFWNGGGVGGMGLGGTTSELRVDVTRCHSTDSDTSGSPSPAAEYKVREFLWHF